MQAFPVSTVEPAERFTRLTTTAARASKTIPEKTVRIVSYFSLSVRFFAVRHEGGGTGG